MIEVPRAEVQEFDLELLSEAALADDPHPDRPLRLSVMGYRDVEDAAGGEGNGVVVTVEIRTTPAQFRPLFEQWRAIQLGLADRGRKQALAELEQESPMSEEKRAALRAERVGRPDLSDDVTRMTVLEQVRRGLERSRGPVPEDSPPGEQP